MEQGLRTQIDKEIILIYEVNKCGKIVKLSLIFLTTIT